MEPIFELETGKDFADALAEVKKQLAARSFGVLWELNFKDKLQEKGLDFAQNFQVLEVCNPKQAKEVLDRHLDMGYFLPCKVGVYERDGKVYIGMLRPKTLVALAEKDDLKEVAQSVEATMREALEAAR